jgi:hypothetical protein
MVQTPSGMQPNIQSLPLLKSKATTSAMFTEIPAFEKMTGLKRAQIIGKRVTEVLPGIEKDSADWIGIYGKVALTGEPVQFETITMR